jgi:hypothetical protein
MRRPVFALTLASVVLSGCFGSGPYHEVYVRNESDRDWLIRAPIAGDEYPGMFYVSRLKPTADGVGSKWAKEPAPDAMIEILDLDCSLVSAFRPNGAETYAVPEVPGLEITIEPWGSNVSRWNTPEITGLEECGGVLFH